VPLRKTFKGKFKICISLAGGRERTHEELTPEALEVASRRTHGPIYEKPYFCGGEGGGVVSIDDERKFLHLFPKPRVHCQSDSCKLSPLIRYVISYSSPTAWLPKKSNVHIFILKMAIEMFVETIDNIQHSARMIPDVPIFTINCNHENPGTKITFQQTSTTAERKVMRFTGIKQGNWQRGW
jgi:hypothetical protein